VRSFGELLAGTHLAGDCSLVGGGWGWLGLMAFGGCLIPIPTPYAISTFKVNIGRNANMFPQFFPLLVVVSY